jgi:membrane protease YdiL (CAAX protease family)
MPDALIDRQRMPREYQHMMRGPRHAWWRPPLAVALTVVFTLLILFAVFRILVATGHRQWLDAGMTRQGMAGPGPFALTNLMWAAVIPTSMLATRIAHGVAPGYLSSVTGGLRWRWLARCLAIIAPLYVVYVSVDLLVDWPEGSIPERQGLLLLVVLVSTPLQAAGEEYLFRGLVLQNLGAWFRSPRVALVVSTIVSAGIFAVAHGSADPWILLDLATGAVAGCILTWSTGGLEAAIVLHASNNVISMVASILVGGWGDGFVEADSKGDPLDLLLPLLTCIAAVTLVLRRARAQNLQRAYQPAVLPDSVSDAAGSRRMNGWTWTAVAVFGALAALALAVFVMMAPARRARLRASGSAQLGVIDYVDIAGKVGITPDGCLRGFIIDALPVEIREFESRELVTDDAIMQIGELDIGGAQGMFQFPVSAELMASNPPMQIRGAGGNTIKVRFDFRDASVQARGRCQPEPTE